VAQPKEKKDMPVRLPEPLWPAELLEEGPPEDPTILLGGAAEIGHAPYRVLAVRLNPNSLAVDYRADLQETVYADYQLEGILDELTFMDDIDKSVLVAAGGSQYVIWMMPFSQAGRKG
jgi:hypothetical protein